MLKDLFLSFLLNIFLPSFKRTIRLITAALCLLLCLLHLGLTPALAGTKSATSPVPVVTPATPDAQAVGASPTPQPDTSPALRAKTQNGLQNDRAATSKTEPKADAKTRVRATQQASPYDMGDIKAFDDDLYGK